MTTATEDADDKGAQEYDAEANYFTAEIEFRVGYRKMVEARGDGEKNRCQRRADAAKRCHEGHGEKMQGHGERLQRVDVIRCERGEQRKRDCKHVGEDRPQTSRMLLELRDDGPAHA